MSDSCPSDYTKGRDVTGFESCFPNICMIDKVVCSNKGLCLQSVAGETACHCDQKLDPTKQCSNCADGFSKDESGTCVSDACKDIKCQNNGYCQDGVCICPNNYNPTNNCQTCIENYKEITFQGKKVCQGVDCIQNGKVCNNVTICQNNECQCAPGWDRSKQCSVCSQGYTQLGNDCILSKCISQDKICNGTGKCEAEGCQCEKNYDSQNQCKTCISGNEEVEINGVKKCLIADCVIEGLICNNNGSCKNNKCVCKNNFDENQKCKACKDSDIEVMIDEVIQCVNKNCFNQSGEICNQSGVCVEGKCVCELGLDSEQKCEKCPENSQVIDGICISDACLVDKIICSNKGTCVNGQCECEGNFDKLSLCKTCKDGDKEMQIQEVTQCIGPNCIKDNQICFQKGTCKDNKCVCEKNYDDLTNCLKCLDTFKEFEVQGVKQCISLESPCIDENSQICNNKGTCNDNKCECHFGLDSGSKCSICPKKMTAIDDTCVSDNCINDGIVCSNRGSCNKPQYQDFSCQCNGLFEASTQCGCSGRINGEVCLPAECLTMQDLNGEIDKNSECNGNGTCTKKFLGKIQCSCENNLSVINKCWFCTGLMDSEECIPKECLTKPEDPNAEFSKDFYCHGKGICILSGSKYQCQCENFLSYQQKCKDCGNGLKLTNGTCIPEECLTNATPYEETVDKNLICNNQGECVNPKSGIPECQCVNHFEQSSKCMNCIQDSVKFTDGSRCIPKDCLTSKTTTIDENSECNGHGICGKKLQCQCKGWFTGSQCLNCGKGVLTAERDRCIPTQCLTKPAENTPVNASFECSGLGKCINNPKDALFGVLKPICSCSSQNSTQKCESCADNFALRVTKKLVADNSEPPKMVEIEERNCIPITCKTTENGYCNDQNNCVFWENTNKFICRCEKGFDVGKGCADCINNLDINTGCQRCKLGFDEMSICSSCKYGYKQNQVTGLCDSCVSGFDIAKDCKACVGEFDIAKRCQGCKDGFTKKGESCVIDFNDKSIRAYIGIGLFVFFAALIIGGVFLIRHLRGKSERKFLAQEAEHQELNESITGTDFAEI